MKIKSFVKMALAVFSLLLIFNFGAYGQKTDCSATTDVQTVDAIYDGMKIKYENQMNHINVRSKDGVVTLEGWTTTKKIRKEIEKIAKKTSCVKRVTNDLTVGAGGGCGPGTKKCGGTCIPTSETCNVRGG